MLSLSSKAYEERLPGKLVYVQNGVDQCYLLRVYSLLSQAGKRFQLREFFGVRILVVVPVFGVYALNHLGLVKSDWACC